MSPNRRGGSKGVRGAPQARRKFAYANSYAAQLSRGGSKGFRGAPQARRKFAYYPRHDLVAASEITLDLKK